MQSESATPIEERYLWIEGRASSASVDLIRVGLPVIQPPNSAVVFVSFAYADLPFSKRFDIIFPKGRPHEGVRCECQIVAATQQVGKPLLEIPHGWKTICILRFTAGVPDLVEGLPVVDTWFQNKEGVCVCDEATWERLKARL